MQDDLVALSKPRSNQMIILHNLHPGRRRYAVRRISMVFSKSAAICSPNHRYGPIDAEAFNQETYDQPSMTTAHTADHFIVKSPARDYSYMTLKQYISYGTEWHDFPFESFDVPLFCDMMSAFPVDQFRFIIAVMSRILPGSVDMAIIRTTLY